MVADQSAQVPLTPNVFSFKRPLIPPSEPSWIVELAEVLAGRTGAPRAAVIHVDPDGDLDPPRRGPKAVKNPGPELDSITLQCAKESDSSSSIGHQLWNGALLLCDVILALGSSLEDVTVLELGSGTGILGPLLHPVAKRVFLTDVGNAVLSTCQLNVAQNCCGLQEAPEKVVVKELDWFGPFPWTRQPGSEKKVHSVSLTLPWLEWIREEVGQLRDVRLLLAADVIYDGDATEAFLDCASQLMRHIKAASGGAEPILLVALEKRFNFAIGDKEPAAHAFNHFRSLVLEEEILPMLTQREGSASTDQAETSRAGVAREREGCRDEQFQLHVVDGRQGGITLEQGGGGRACLGNDQDVVSSSQPRSGRGKKQLQERALRGQPLPLEVLPQFMLCDRSKDLELWVLQLVG